MASSSRDEINASLQLRCLLMGLAPDRAWCLATACVVPDSLRPALSSSVSQFVFAIALSSSVAVLAIKSVSLNSNLLTVRVSWLLDDVLCDLSMF